MPHLPPIAKHLSDNFEDELMLYIPQADIQKKVREIAQQIHQTYTESNELTVIIILRGAFIFASDLIRNLAIPVQMDFVRLRSYGAGTSSSGHVELTKDIEINLADKDVLIIDEIIDSGITIDFLIKRIHAMKPNSVKVAVLLDKKERRQIDINPDFCGQIVEDKFLVGYGLDYNERYRQLADIYYIEG